METAQIVKREFKGGFVEQNHKTGWLNATSFLSIANTYREQIGLNKKSIGNYIKNDSTKEFVKKILDEENIAQAYITKKGKNGGTWMHPFLFIDFVMWISPDFKYQAIKWLNDELLKYRDTSGDSYKQLATTIANYQTKIGYGDIGIFIKKVARTIKQILDVEDWNSTTEDKLKKRDEIHKSLSMMIKAGVDINKALQIIYDEYKS